MDKKQKVYKFVFIGDASVGKTSIIGRFADDAFGINYISTIGIDFKIRSLQIEGELIKLQIWDTAGQERFRSITTSYYRGATCIIIAFDLTNMKSFENTERWLNDTNVITSCYKVLVGSKSDLVDKNNKNCVPEDKIRNLCTKHNLPYYVVSAKLGTGIEEMFVKSCTELYNKSRVKAVVPPPDNKKTTKDISITDKPKPKPRKSLCTIL